MPRSLPATPNDKLKSRREATPSPKDQNYAMSRADLAVLVVDHVYEHHGRVPAVDRKYIGKLESGRITWPNAAVRDALRAALKADSDLALGFYDSSQLGRPSAPPLVSSTVNPAEPDDHAHRLALVDITKTPWTIEGSHAVAALLSEVSPVNRRRFLALAPASLLALCSDSLVARMSGGPASQARGAIEATDGDLVTLMRIGDELRRLDDQCGGGVVLALAQGHLRHVVELLNGARYSETVGKGLHSYVAEVMRICGWECWDTGDFDMAKQYLAGALHCAQVAGDDQVRANVLSFLAGLTLEEGQPEDAAHLASAARLCLHGSPMVGAVAHAQFAEAAAVLGARRDALEAMDSAWSAFDRAGGEGPPWAYWIDRGIHEMTGRTYMYLDDHERAIDALSRCVSNTPAGREQARALDFLALALARSGEPDEACSVATGAIALLQGGVMSPRSVAGLGRVRTALEPYDTAAVRELDERLVVLA